MRNTRIKKEMNDWLAIYRRQNVSVGRQDGSDPVSSSVSDFVENEVFAFQWGRWCWKKANFQNRMNSTPWESLRCLIACCNPCPFKILQFWRRWCATMWGRAITPSTLQSTLWLGAEVGIRFVEANKRILTDITLTLMQADSKIPSKFFPFTNIFMIKPFSFRHACTRRHILHLMVPSSRWGAPVSCSERWLDGRSWLLVMTFWWDSSDFSIAGQEDWDPWMLWGKIIKHEVSTSLVACCHFLADGWCLTMIYNR